MRTLAHVSDLHFGRVDRAIVAGLRDDLRSLAPDLVVATGDLTQRARRAEFRAAAAFLESLGRPWLAVPGNHDVPFYDVARRFLSPFGRYRRLVNPVLEPDYTDAEMAVLGLNTAHAYTWKDGKLRPEQLQRVAQWAAEHGDARLRVVVGHHPFVPPEDKPRKALVRDAVLALHTFQACGVDLVLAGHLHVGYTGDARTHHVQLARSVLFAQAGTATSTRTRGEPNSYHLVRVAMPELVIETRGWDGSRFAAVGERRFVREAMGWVKTTPRLVSASTAQEALREP